MKPKKHIMIHLLFLAFSLICILPIILLISTSLTTQEELIASGVQLWPKTPNIQAYKMVFQYPVMIFNAYKVSFIVTVVGTVLSLLMSAMVAYPLAKPNYKFAKVTSFFIYFTVLFSGGIVPFYILNVQILHLKDNIWVLILPLLASPWIIFLLRTFFRDVPSALFEAAKIDGASEYKIFFKILLPLTKPALATAGLMIALLYWNDWYNAMLFIDDSDLRPIQLMLQQLNDFIAMLRNNQMKGAMKLAAEVPSDGIVAATCMVAVGPMLCIFMVFQRYFIRGIATGAVKE